jgi:hypothetical protein
MSLDQLIEDVQTAIDEKSSPPKPPGEGWQMVFGRWVQTGKKTKAPEEPSEKPKKPLKQRVKEKVKAKVKAAGQALKDLPGNAKKFVQDKKFRKKVGKDMAAAVRRKSAAAVDTIKHEVKEFKMAGAAVKKVAKGEKLNDHDKKAIKAVVKAVAMTVGGTIAMGGVGHLTAAALGQHFAAETAIKSVGKAALFADLMTEDEAAFEQWVKKMMNDIADKLEGLGDMSEEELAAIIKKYGKKGDKKEESEDFPNRLAANIISADDDQYPMRSRSRWRKGRKKKACCDACAQGEPCEG